MKSKYVMVLVLSFIISSHVYQLHHKIIKMQLHELAKASKQQIQSTISVIVMK